LRGAATLIAILAFVPGLPGPLFVTLSAAGFAASHLSRRRQRAEAGEAQQRAVQLRRSTMRRPESALGLVGVDAISIDFGAQLLGLLAKPHDELLLDRIGEVRRALAMEIGIAIPGVRLRDDLMRDPHTYAIRIRDAVAAAGTLQLDTHLAVGDSTALSRLGGRPVREPVYGLDARAIERSQREEAQRYGLMVFDPVSIVGSHLAEVARGHAADLFGRQEFATLLEHLRASAPALIKEIGDAGIPLTLAHRVFVLLLREKLWPRDPLLTLEALVDAADIRDARELTELVRRRLVPLELRRRNETLCAAIVTPELEELLVRYDAGEAGVAPDPLVAAQLRKELTAHAQRYPRYPAVITSARVRPLLGELAARWGVGIEVFAYSELPREMPLEPLGVIGTSLPPSLSLPQGMPSIAR
jgi:flagellar biosynthesis protein FlhA